MKKSKKEALPHREVPLPICYKKIINKVRGFYLAIVGKAPYPHGAFGIPFCKETWKEMEAHNCSGLYVLRSLGLNISNVKKQYSPVQLFKKMAMLGIVFLNVTYDLIDGPLRKREHENSLKNVSAKLTAS